MSNYRSQERNRSKAPGRSHSQFAEHVGVGVAIVTNRRNARRGVFAAIGVLAAAGLVDYGSRVLNKLAPENPGIAQRQAALNAVDAQDGPIEIKAGSNYRSTPEFLDPNDQGSGPTNYLGTLTRNIIIPKPLEGSNAGWDATELPVKGKLSGSNSLKADKVVWLDVKSLVGQGMAHYLHQSGTPTYGQIEVNPSGTVSQVEANGTVVSDTGAGLSYDAPGNNHHS